MSLELIDSCGDHLATGDITQKWTSFISSGPGVSAGNGRRGGNGYNVNGGNGMLKGLAAKVTRVVGVAVNFSSTLPSSTSNSLIELRDGSTIHVSMTVDTVGGIRVYRGDTNSGTLLASTAAGLISAATYNYIEFKATINDSTGAYEVRLNGANVLSATGVDTKNGASSAASSNAVMIGGLTNATRLDDIYILNTDGSANNDFLGDVRVDVYRPNGNGNSSQLTGSDGNSVDNYLHMDETTPDGDTSYVESATAGHKDTYTFENMSHTPNSIKGVQAFFSAKKDDAGLKSVCVVVRSDGADTDGATKYLSTSYNGIIDIFENDPDTSAAWDVAGFNAAEFGLKVVS